MRAAPLDAIDRSAALQAPAHAIGPNAPAAAAEAPAALPSTAISPLDQALQGAATLQGGLNGLFAELAAVLQGSALPPEAAAAATALLQAGLPLDPPPSPAALKAAVASSGLFYEADLAEGVSPQAGDLKALLLQLRAALPVAVGGAGADAPPPPSRDGVQAAQPALAALLGAGLSSEAQLGRLSRRTAAALSRQVLMQAASAGVGRRGLEGPPGRAWLFELPLATPEGTAVAQFEIDADDEGARDGAPRAWRTRFTFDVPSTGPVHARISFSAGRTRVALWVEDADTLAKLSARRDELDVMMAEAELPAQVAILPGAPAAAPPPPPGRFVARSA